ncbi:hypothetical protein [Primorskyibacter sp. S87]|uniref:hypothetical protein n=1 Tax=Primorskyibacter sp. S87 TaxID=3415126 RepID=UPI003C7B0754
MTALTEQDWGRIFAKAWSDPGFRAAYEKDPRSAVREHAASLGLDPDAKFSFPDKPSNMSDEHAKDIAEGKATIHPMYCC